MRLAERLKTFKNQYMHIKWATGCGYGKLVHVGRDFIEFNVVDIDTMTNDGTIIINAGLILEVAVASSDVMRVIAEVCANTEA